MATFRPSARSRLQLRIDEGADVAGLEARLEQDPPAGATVQDTVPTTEDGRRQELELNRQRRRQVTRERANLSTSELNERTSRLDRRRNALQLGGAQDQTRPQGLTKTDADDLTVGVDLIPVTARIERNGLMEADTASITFDFSTLPVDPRILRAVFIDLVIGTVTADEFQQGVVGVVRGDGSPLSLVGRIPGQEIRQGSSTRFVGYVDDWSTSAGPDGDMVEVTARDLTAPLIDERLPSGLRLDLQKPLADAVQELIDNFAATRGLQVIFGNPADGGADRGNRGPIIADAVPKPRKARRGRQTRRVRSGDAAMSVWDHIVDTVVAGGYLPVIRGMQLYIIEPRTFYERRAGAKRLVYGHNLVDLQFARKLGGSKVPTIEVRCPDPEIGKTRWARAPVKPGQIASGVFGEQDPPKARRANKVSPGGTTQEEIKTILVSGISDGSTLERVARSLYEQIGRQEIEGSFATYDITAFGSDDEGDLLDLQAGDPVELLIAPLNSASSGDSTNTTPGGSVNSYQEIASFSIGRRQLFLERLGYPPATASRLALAQEQTALNTTFRVQDVIIDWSQADGVRIEGDFVNFIVIREIPDAGTQPASAAVQDLTAGRFDPEAVAALSASSAGNTLGAEARVAALSPVTYAEQGTTERSRQQRAQQALRRSK